MFVVNEQQDAHELLRCLLAYVQDATKELNKYRLKQTVNGGTQTSPEKQGVKIETSLKTERETQNSVDTNSKACDTEKPFTDMDILPCKEEVKCDDKQKLKLRSFEEEHSETSDEVTSTNSKADKVLRTENSASPPQDMESFENDTIKVEIFQSPDSSFIEEKEKKGINKEEESCDVSMKSLDMAEDSSVDSMNFLSKSPIDARPEEYYMETSPEKSNLAEQVQTLELNSEVMHNKFDGKHHTDFCSKHRSNDDNSSVGEYLCDKCGKQTGLAQEKQSNDSHLMDFTKAGHWSALKQDGDNQFLELTLDGQNVGAEMSDRCVEQNSVSEQADSDGGNSDLQKTGKATLDSSLLSVKEPELPKLPSLNDKHDRPRLLSLNDEGNSSKLPSSSGECEDSKGLDLKQLDGKSDSPPGQKIKLLQQQPTVLLTDISQLREMVVRKHNNASNNGCSVEKNVRETASVGDKSLRKDYITPKSDMIKNGHSSLLKEDKLDPIVDSWSDKFISPKKDNKATEQNHLPRNLEVCGKRSSLRNLQQKSKSADDLSGLSASRCWHSKSSDDILVGRSSQAKSKSTFDLLGGRSCRLILSPIEERFDFNKKKSVLKKEPPQKECKEIVKVNRVTDRAKKTPKVRAHPSVTGCKKVKKPLSLKKPNKNLLLENNCKLMIENGKLVFDSSKLALIQPTVCISPLPQVDGTIDDTESQGRSGSKRVVLKRPSLRRMHRSKTTNNDSNLSPKKVSQNGSLSLERIPRTKPVILKRPSLRRMGRSMTSNNDSNLSPKENSQNESLSLERISRTKPQTIIDSSLDGNCSEKENLNELDDKLLENEHRADCDSKENGSGNIMSYFPRKRYGITRRLVSNVVRLTEFEETGKADETASFSGELKPQPVSGFTDDVETLGTNTISSSPNKLNTHSPSKFEKLGFETEQLASPPSEPSLPPSPPSTEFSTPLTTTTTPQSDDYYTPPESNVKSTPVTSSTATPLSSKNRSEKNTSLPLRATTRSLGMCKKQTARKSFPSGRSLDNKQILESMLKAKERECGNDGIRRSRRKAESGRLYF